MVLYSYLGDVYFLVSMPSLSTTHFLSIYSLCFNCAAITLIFSFTIVAQPQVRKTGEPLLMTVKR